MNVKCATCGMPLASGEAMLLHHSHGSFEWFCRKHWEEWVQRDEHRLAEQHAAAMARARHAAVIPREEEA